jgi:hypothetical protein
LKILSPALQSFIQVFEIDPYLVLAAAETSPDPKKALAVDYRELLSRLSRSECDDFLTRVAESDPGVGLALRKRLGAFLPKERTLPARARTVQQLLRRAEQLEKAEVARQKHIAEMKALVVREDQTWKQVDTLLETGRKIASVYDEVTAMLEKLHQLAEFQDTREVFRARLHQFAQKYASRSSLIARWKKRGWV